MNHRALRIVSFPIPLALFSILLATCPTAIEAGEGYKEVTSGATVRLAGYGIDSAEVHAAPPVQIDFNRTIWIRGGDPQWILRPADDAEIQALVANTVVAIGLWENLPTTRLEFTLGLYRRREQTFAADGVSLMTLAGGTYAYAGQGGGLLVRSGNGTPEIAELDILLLRSNNRNDRVGSQATMVQELGHGVGFNHSWLNDGVVADITGGESLPAMMSYGGGREAVVASGALGPDDVALASRLYPDLTNPLSRTTGTIRGRFLDAEGNTELLGGCALVIDRSTGGAVVSRITGYESSAPGSRKYGSFEMDGVPPGRYDVLIASSRDRGIVLGNPEPSIDDMILEADGSTDWPDALVRFDTDFRRTWVRDIRVEAGDVIDAGNVLAGEDRNFSAPSRLDVTVAYEGARRFARFAFGFWLEGQGIVVRGQNTLPHYTARLAPARYAVRIHGWDGQRWVQIQDWVWHDYRAVELTFEWERVTRRVDGGRRAEPLAYLFSLSYPGELFGRLALVHGRRYRLHAARGDAHGAVLAWWSADEATTPVLALAPVDFDAR